LAPGLGRAAMIGGGGEGAERQSIRADAGEASVLAWRAECGPALAMLSHERRWAKVAPWTWASQALISLSCGVRTDRHLHVNATSTWAARERTVRAQLRDSDRHRDGIRG
jgi:hypothetical protein